MSIKKIKYTIWKIIFTPKISLFFSKFSYGQFLLKTGRKKIKQNILEKYFSEFEVKRGPFKAMKLLKANYNIDSILPKLSGSYEFEIQEIINQLVKKNYKNILNIGSAEGYYLVGFALKIPSSNIIGFETEQANRDLSRRMSQLNNVSGRIEIFGNADESSILGLDRMDNILIFSDCEGAELDIFSFEVIEKFKNADFLIETHDCFRPGLTNELQIRFESTHQIQVINWITNDKRPVFSPSNCKLSFVEKFHLSEERREVNNGWIFCRSKS